MMQLKNAIVLGLVGPTGSGKTKLAKMISNSLPIEVISCDSMQVYKNMPILTQAPTKSETQGVPYHLLQQIPLNQTFNAAMFVKNCNEIIVSIHQKKKIPLICGGTGLYLNAFLDGLFEGGGESLPIRQALLTEVQGKGSDFLYQRLVRLDDEAAKIIHPNDVRRIVRALEVIEITGKKFSYMKKMRKGSWGKYPIKLWGIMWDRKELNQRIDARAEKMLESGAIEEVDKLISSNEASKTAMSCLGIKEISSYIKNQITYDEALDQLKRNTRRYAKRQMTWFRSDKRIEWIQMSSNDSDALENACQRIIDHSLKMI